MKILFVSARLPYPLDTGGKIRAFNILKALAVEHEVTMLTQYARAEELDSLGFFGGLGIKVLPVLNKAIDRQGTVGSVLRSFVEACPFNVLKYDSVPFAREMAKAVEAGCDVIHCEHLHVAYRAHSFAKCKQVLDAHNVESEIARRVATFETSPLKRAVLNWHAGKTFSYESTVVRGSDMVLAVSGKDRDTLCGMSSRPNSVVIENGVDTDFFRAQPVERGKTIVFVGSMDWRPNVDGVLYFCESILPRIRQRHPDIKFVVVGRNPGPAILDLAVGNGSVVVTGTVDDVRPYVESATVFVVPLRFGGGTRLKILEAFSMERAVVSTSLGIEGIDHIHGEHALIADEPGAFADAVSQLLIDRGLAERIGRKARELACAKYGWDAIGARLRESYRLLSSGEML